MAIEGLDATLPIEGTLFTPAMVPGIVQLESGPTLDDMLRLEAQTKSEPLQSTPASIDNGGVREAIIVDLWMNEATGAAARELTIFEAALDNVLSLESVATVGKHSESSPMSFGNWYEWQNYGFSACVMGSNGVPIAGSLEEMRANMCPTGHTCVPYGTNGLFVRDTADNHIYMTEAGWNRYQNGTEIDWAGVARDLLYITGGALGGIGSGTAGVVAAMLGLGGWTLNFWSNGPTQ